MNQTGAITTYIDVAQLTLYAFWIFFAGLILYLRREDKREGYPLLSDRSDRVTVQGFPDVPSSKTFILHDGTTRQSPRVEERLPFNSRQVQSWQGAPFEPNGDPMLAAVGPGAYANRPDEPDLAFDDNLPKIVPLRAAGDFFLAWEDPDPRGMAMLGADNVRAGTVVDAWVDRAEVVIRYLEVELAVEYGGHRVLVPMNFTQISKKRREIKVGAILAAHFATVPLVKQPDTITFLEEDKIMAYYGGGLMYAMASRSEPLL